MRVLTTCLVLAATGTAHAEPEPQRILAIDGTAVVRHMYTGDNWGHGAMLRTGVAFRVGDNAWVEPGGALRIAYFDHADTPISTAAHDKITELLFGGRVGLVADGVRPWLGGYVGVGNRDHDTGEDMSSYSGLALDAALGVDFDVRSWLRAGVRVDIARDTTKYDNNTSNWYAIGAGLTYAF
jgi:hypothetical protein